VLKFLKNNWLAPLHVARCRKGNKKCPSRGCQLKITSKFYNKNENYCRHGYKADWRELI